jgi:copper chaperone CopZ
MDRPSPSLTRFAGALLLFGGLVSAADPPPVTVTTITIQGMHCAGCAAKITGKLKSVQHVQLATVDHLTGLATITAKTNHAVSPRALWETVERAGYKPTQLTGPSGTYTKKPSQ